jgi:hypothetical protein
LQHNYNLLSTKKWLLDSLQKKWETHQRWRRGEPEGSIVGDGMLADFLAFDLQCQIFWSLHEKIWFQS